MPTPTRGYQWRPTPVPVAEYVGSMRETYEAMDDPYAQLRVGTAPLLPEQYVGPMREDIDPGLLPPWQRTAPTLFPEADIGGASVTGLEPQFTPRLPIDIGLRGGLPEISFETVQTVKNKSKDAAPPGQQLELDDIIDRAFVGAYSAADASTILAMDQEYDNQITAVYDDPKSYIGGNMEGELTTRAQNQVNLLIARQEALRDIQDELTAYNTAAQTQSLEQQEIARTAEQGRALTQLISSQFPGLIPEGAQISPANMNVLLQLATLKSQQEQIESQRQDTLAQRQRSTSLARELFPEMELGDVSVGPGELGMLLQIAQYRQQQQERQMAGRGPDVTIYRGFEGE